MCEYRHGVMRASHVIIVRPYHAFDQFLAHPVKLFLVPDSAQVFTAIGVVVSYQCIYKILHHTAKDLMVRFGELILEVSQTAQNTHSPADEAVPPTGSHLD